MGILEFFGFRSKRADSIAKPEPLAASALEAEYIPTIGISGENSDSKSVAAMMTQICSAGAKAVFLGEHKDAGKDIAGLDAVIIMGSNFDADPKEYGVSDVHAKTRINPDTSRARYEDALIALATERKIPLMGVCAGMQRINIANHAQEGGTLLQHVPDLVGNESHMQTEAPFVGVQFIHLKPGSKLAGIADDIKSVAAPSAGQKETVLHENAMHHQAVETVRKGFIASAISSDGIIEAIEPDPKGPYAGQYIVAVQFHPEFGASKIGPKLAAAITTEARQYGLAHQSEGSHKDATVQPAPATDVSFVELLKLTSP